MRLDKLTIKSQEAIQEAQGQCSARGHQSLEASHLLAALLAQPDGSTLPILQKLGVSARSTRERAGPPARASSEGHRRRAGADE